jgi:hypothetical protein
MRPVEHILEMGGEGMGRMIEGWIQQWHIVRTVVNVTMYSQCNNNK